ncbi:MAG: DUF59 domain-containing protein [Acidobacteria bacterium]|nr:DUF59 domain-containing protein [Acidobacteriota bacterium]
MSPNTRDETMDKPLSPTPTADDATPPRASGTEPSLEERVTEALQQIYDPEIPVNIYALGLIYDVEVDGSKVLVRMTLTSPACPVAGSLPGEVEQKVLGVYGVDECDVELVWDPVWNPEMMSDEAKLELGFL